MTYCSDCYWVEQCGCPTITLCSDFTPLTDDDPSAEQAYLEAVRADASDIAMTTPDDFVGGVSYKSRNTAQHLYL